MPTIRESQHDFQSSVLRLWLLGHPCIEMDNESCETHLNTRSRALIYYLVVNRQTHTRDELATLFWDNMPNVQARKNLRNLLPLLRTFLHAHVIITHHTVTFNAHTSFWLDVDTFCRLLTPPLDTLETDTLWEAVTLYRGDFLQGLSVRNAPQFEEWMTLKRERMRAMVLDALTILAERHIQQHEYQRGLTATRHLLELEPWNEIAHQHQMALFALQGRRDAALAQYDICCRIIHAEFGMNPLPETTALYQTIQSGTLRTTHAIGNHADRKNALPSSPSPRAQQIQSHPDQQTPLLETFAHNHICMSPDGTLLVATQADSATITVWNIRTGTPYARLEGHDDRLTALACGPCGRVASGSSDGTIFLWEITGDTQRCHTLAGHCGHSTALTFTPDGTLLASGCSDGAIYLWNTTTYAIQHKLDGHTGHITTIAFSPDQKTVISGYDHRKVQTWCVQTGMCLVAFDCAAGAT